MEPLRPIGPSERGPAPVRAVRRLTREERDQAARERERRRRERRSASGSPPEGDEPPSGAGSIDVRA